MNAKELFDAIIARPEGLYYAAVPKEYKSRIWSDWSKKLHLYHEIPDVGYDCFMCRDKRKLERSLGERRKCYHFMWVFAPELDLHSVCKVGRIKVFFGNPEARECSIDTSLGDSAPTDFHGYICNETDVLCVQETKAELSVPDLEFKPDVVTAQSVCNNNGVVAFFMLLWSVILQIVLRLKRVGFGSKECGLIRVPTVARLRSIHKIGFARIHVRTASVPRAKRVNDMFKGRFMPRVTNLLAAH